jgi:hypothetical protein
LLKAAPEILAAPAAAAAAATVLALAALGHLVKGVLAAQDT